MRSWKGLVLVLVFAGLALASGPCPARAGNGPLMDAWKARQQELSQKIAKRLFDEGRIPQNGTVRYTARVKPDASASGGLVLGVDSLSVIPARPGNAQRLEGEAAIQAMAKAFEPRDPALAVRLQNLDVPVGTEVRGALVIKDGKPVPQDIPEPQPAPAPVPPEEPSAWQKLMKALGL